MALRRRIGNLAEILLKQNLAAQQAEDQDALIRRRQAELSRQGAEQQILGKTLGDDSGQMVERLLAGGISKLGGIDLSGLRHTREDAANRVSTAIASTDTLGKAMTPADIVGAYQGEAGASNVAPGGSNEIDPTTGLIPTPKRTAIEDLMAQNQAKVQGLRRAAPPVQRKFMNPAGIESEVTVNPYDDQGVERPTERTPEQEGARTGAVAVAAQPGTTAAKVAETNALAGPQARAAGMREAATSAAAYPWQVKIAQVRADNSLLAQKEMDDYKRTHPKLTGQELNRANTAITGQGYLRETRALMEEMAKRNLLGPVAGRVNEIMAGKIKAEDLFQNPDEAKLAANFFSSMGYLSSLIAVVHGGSKGGGSIQLVKEMQKQLNAGGDPSIIAGQMDALDRLLTHYREDPGRPEPMQYPTPGSEPAPGGPGGELDPTIQELLNRGVRR